MRKPPPEWLKHAAEHELDTGPTTAEAEALLAEQHAGAATDAEIEQEAAEHSAETDGTPGDGNPGDDSQEAKS